MPKPVLMIPLMVRSGADDPSSATVKVRFAANAIGADMVAPVSYTHLDVYKRQVFSMMVMTCVNTVLVFPQASVTTHVLV